MKRIVTLATLFCVAITTIIAQPQKVVLIEEGTGTWCQWCPRGDVYSRALAENYSGQYVFVAIHEGDPMETTDYWEAIGLLGLPTAKVDRTYISELNPFVDLQQDMAQQLALSPPAGISVETTWDASTREMTMTISADFVENLSGNYRLAAIVVEDGVTGPAPYYSQSNSYSGGGAGPMGGYEDLPSPVPAGFMMYNHVGRHLPGGFIGDPASLPNSIAAGETHSFTYSYTLPEEYNEEYVHAVGILVNADNEQVLNAGKSNYLPGNANGIPFFHSDGTGIGQVESPFSKTIICHDPDYDDLTISGGVELPSWLTIEMISEEQATLTGTPPAIGTYSFTLEVTDGIDSRTQDFTLEVIDGSASWIQIGQASFANVVAEYRVKGAKGINADDVYAMAINSNNTAYIYHFDGNDWTEIGDASAGTSLYGDIAVHPETGEPWVYLRTGIFKYSGGSWTQVGSIPSGDSYLDIEFTDDGTPFIASSQGGQGIYVHTYDGTTWNALPAPNNEFLLAWIRLRINSEGLPIILVNEFPSWGGYSRVYEYDGSDWVAFGDRINPDKFTSGSSSSLHQFALGANDDPYVIIGHDDGSSVYSWDGTDWDVIAENIDNGVRENFDIEAGENGDIFVAYETASGSLTCERWDGTSWSYVGAPDFAPSANVFEMYMYSDGLPGVVYKDLAAGGTLSAKRYMNLLNSVEEIKNEDAILVYPNPTSSVLYFRGSIFNNQFYEVYDMQGKRVLAGHIQANQIDVSLLSGVNGAYLLKLIKDDKIRTLKFIVR